VVPDKLTPNRAKDYRNRAEAARAKAISATDDKTRAEQLQVADIWERMAAWEDKQHSMSPAMTKEGKRKST
jgi:hypothetical protein